MLFPLLHSSCADESLAESLPVNNGIVVAVPVTMCQLHRGRMRRAECFHCKQYVTAFADTYLGIHSESSLLQEQSHLHGCAADTYETNVLPVRLLMPCMSCCMSASVPDWDGCKIAGNGDERIELERRGVSLVVVSRSGHIFILKDRCNTFM